MPYEIPSNIMGWVYKHAVKNAWRVSAFYDADDLVQDGFMVAYKCLDRYGIPGIEIDEPNFTALVKRAFHNHIGDLLRNNRGLVEVFVSAGSLSETMSESDAVDRQAEREPVSDFDMAELLVDLPAHLRKVVNLYLSEDGLKALNRPLRARFGNADESLSERLAKLVGFPVDGDFEGELRAFLWERSEGLV